MRYRDKDFLRLSYESTHSSSTKQCLTWMNYGQPVSHLNKLYGKYNDLPRQTSKK